MNNIKSILEAVSIWIVIVPVLCGSWLVKKMSHDSFIIYILVLVAVPPQIVTYFVELHTRVLNIFYNIYTPCEFILLFWLFRNKYQSKKNRVAFQISGLIYVICAAMLLSQYGITKIFINEWACLNNLVYIIWIMMYIFEVFYYDKPELSLNNSFLYYMIGILFYSQCSILVFSLYYFISQNKVLGNTWILQSVGNIMMYMLFTLGFINKQRASADDKYYHFK